MFASGHAKKTFSRLITLSSQYIYEGMFFTRGCIIQQLTNRLPFSKHWILSIIINPAGMMMHDKNSPVYISLLSVSRNTHHLPQHHCCLWLLREQENGGEDSHTSHSMASLQGTESICRVYPHSHYCSQGSWFTIIHFSLLTFNLPLRSLNSLMAMIVGFISFTLWGPFSLILLPTPPTFK